MVAGGLGELVDCVAVAAMASPRLIACRHTEPRVDGVDALHPPRVVCTWQEQQLGGVPERPGLPGGVVGQQNTRVPVVQP